MNHGSVDVFLVVAGVCVWQWLTYGCSHHGFACETAFTAQSTGDLMSLIMLRRDIVKDDSGAYAVFTEQGSSASHTTAAQDHACYCKITMLRWTSSRDAVSSYTENGGRSKIA